MGRRKARIAAIDVGTNSVHMIIVEALRHGYRVIDREKETVQLGRDSLNGQPLTDDAMERAVGAIKRMVEIARRSGVGEIVAVATSAVREAPNRRRFLNLAEKEAGTKVRVISGEEEADLIFRAVRSAVDFQGGTALSLDIGGGSVELVVGTLEEVYFTSSEPLGALRLTQEFRNDPPGKDELRDFRRRIRKSLKKPLTRARAVGFDFVIGTSGTIVTLAELGADENDDSISSGLRRLTTWKLEELVGSMSTLSAAERSQKFAIDPKRAETILAGALVLQEALDILGVDSLLACHAALREGLVERAIEGNAGDRSSGSTRKPSAMPVRRSSILQLAERVDHDRAHATHVARLALRIFDQTQELHSLRPADRELLEYAALLHEIGIHVSFQSHHKHTYYLIRHAGLRGFTEDQVAMLANVARYYRKATPDEGHPNFAELSPGQRSTVSRLVSILRIAEALDRSHHQAVRDIAVEVNGHGVVFKIRPRLDCEIEMESAEKRARYFAKVFETKVSLETIAS